MHIQFVSAKAVVMLMAILSACPPNQRTNTETPGDGADRGEPRIEQVAASHYERNQGKSRVIVFINCVYGGAGSTWTSSTNKTWPQLLENVPRFAASDLYVLNYPTSKLGNLMSIDDVVGNVINRLDGDEVLSKHNEVVFLCHSMGGLVVE